MLTIQNKNKVTGFFFQNSENDFCNIYDKIEELIFCLSNIYAYDCVVSERVIYARNI